MRTRWVLTIAMSSLASGCSDKLTVCPTGLVRPAIQLTVVDSGTGRPPSVTPTIVAMSRGDVVPTDLATDNVYWIALRRSGTFDVSVKAQGYVDWSISKVEVSENSCGETQTVHITAKLQR